VKAKIIIILSITCILVVCLFLLWGRLYCPRGVKYGILVKDGVKYILSDE